jgi:regulator of RNase E activity RraB
MSIFGFWGRPKEPDPDLDEAVISRLRKVGSNISKSHKIEFFLYFPSQASADQAAAHIRDSGFQVNVERSAQGDDWLCFAVKSMAPDLTTLQNIRKDFEQLAVSLNGKYDGWGTEVEK